LETVDSLVRRRREAAHFGLFISHFRGGEIIMTRGHGFAWVALASVLPGFVGLASAAVVGDQYWLQAVNFPNTYGPSYVTFDGVEELIGGSNGMYVNESSSAYPGGSAFPAWAAPAELLEFSFRKEAAPLYSSLNPSQLMMGDLDWGMPGMIQVGRENSAFVYFTSNGTAKTMRDVYGLGVVFLPHPLNPSIQVAVLGHSPIIGTVDGLDVPDVFNNRSLGQTMLALGLVPTQINDVHIGVMIDQVQIPEPASALLLGGAGLALVIRRRSR
jgi:hypothetical protein